MPPPWNSTASTPPPTNCCLSVGDEADILYPLGLVVPITVVYAVIFVTGVIGNVSTCIVISCNKSMHTATNYYLFSLAVSDLLLLISGLPPEMYRIWSPTNYVFGGAFCVLQGFAAETSANATVLTITAFTIERYVAICHPFLSHTISKLSRAIRYIIIIWIVALCLAAPQAIQFGVEYETRNNVQYSRCTVVSNSFQHAFEISTFVFFVGPMTLITVLYVLIGLQLRKSGKMRLDKKGSLGSNVSGEMGRAKGAAAQNRVVKMLVAVVAAFFICWAPFHAQRLLAVYLANASEEDQKTTVTLYMVLMYASGILYFLSTTINPVLYNIMSNKFREAFKKTLSEFWRRSPSGFSVQTNSSLLNRQFQRATLDGAHSADPRLKPRTYSFLGCNRVKQDMSVIDCRELHPIFLSKSKSALTAFLKNEKFKNGDNFQLYRIFRQKKLRQESLDSGHTISNSSLQDVDEMDYSSSDLVKYMEEINEDIG